MYIVQNVLVTGDGKQWQIYSAMGLSFALLFTTLDFINIDVWLEAIQTSKPEIQRPKGTQIFPHPSSFSRLEESVS